MGLSLFESWSGGERFGRVSHMALVGEENPEASRAGCFRCRREDATTFVETIAVTEVRDIEAAYWCSHTVVTQGNSY